MNLHEHQTHEIKKIKCNLCDFEAINEEILKKHHVVAMGHKKNEVCRFYLQGHCKKGKFCMFKHKGNGNNISYNSNAKPQNGQSNFAHTTKNTAQFKAQGFVGRNKQCRFFSNCIRFPNCGYVHNEICKFQENCFNIENCRFVHLQSVDFLDRRQIGRIYY